MNKDVVYVYIYIYTHNGILIIKKNEIILFVALWIDLEIVKLSEVSQTKTNIMISLIWRI